MADTHTIFHAADTGELEEIHKYLRQDSGLVLATDDSGATPLLRAAHEGNVDAVDYILDRGADIDHQDLERRTALHHACGSGHTETVNWLLKRHANVRLRDARGGMALISAAWAGYPQVILALLKHGQSLVDACDDEGTALFWTCNQGHPASARILLEAGADPTLHVDHGRQPMAVAMWRNQQQCVNLLQEWERTYLMVKARKLHDASTKITNSKDPLNAAPIYLKDRVIEGSQPQRLSLPGVEIQPVTEVKPVSALSKVVRVVLAPLMQTGEKIAGKEAEEEEQRVGKVKAAVLEWAEKSTKEELFNELTTFLGLDDVDVHEEGETAVDRFVAMGLEEAQ